MSGDTSVPLVFSIPRYRDLWRFRAPLTSGEIRRTERWLATARVALTIATLITLWMEPGRTVVYSFWLYWLLTVYLVHAVVVMILVRFRNRSTRAFRLVVHGADILWPVLISLFTTSERGPFFLFFVFVMAAAAYRWGLWETVGTSLTTVILLWLEGWIVNAGFEQMADQWLHAMHLPRMALGVKHIDPQQLFMFSVYLMVLGFLLGYMSENEKKLRAERVVITRVLSSARVEAGLTQSMQEILGEVLGLYGARRVLSASQEANSYRVFLADVHRTSDGSPLLRWRDALPETEAAYLFESPADALYARRNGKGFDAVLLDGTGKRLRDADTAFLENLMRTETFQSVGSVAFGFGQEWTGRVFIFDPERMGDPEEELRFLQEFAQQVGPAIYNVYLMRRLRERAGAVERSRFARELHDGAIQSLIAVEMQLDVVRRQSGQQPVVTSELSRIQKLLREEVLKLRELMQTMKSFEVDGERLPGFVADTVERFRRETGISAEFVSEIEKVDLPQKVCRELARIVQESLVNVRKHSGARHVLVRLAHRTGNLQLTVEDDGRGFSFSGRLSEAELALTGKGPAIIRERVRLLAGELTIESNPGHGARVEVRIPPLRKTS
ncbi:MAG TPA: ATP-binding protein [Terriglobales bacterium]|nr:ATP-binding protein [Terriglobales bacterium]